MTASALAAAAIAMIPFSSWSCPRGDPRDVPAPVEGIR
jgi:hypothetical protein